MVEYTTNLLIPRQLAASPMLFFPRRIEHAFDVTIQRSRHTYSGEHRWRFHVLQPVIAPALRPAILRHRVLPAAVS